MGSGASISLDNELDQLPTIIDYEKFSQRLGDRLSEAEKHAIFEKCTVLKTVN